MIKVSFRNIIYNGSVNQLVQNISSYSTVNNDFQFDLQDTVGNKKNGYAFYYGIIMKAEKHYITYDLKFEQKGDLNQNKAEVSLVGAHDYHNKIGGYKINGKGVNVLVSILDSDFIEKFNKNQTIRILQAQN
jgi:hypothetical protein